LTKTKQKKNDITEKRLEGDYSPVIMILKFFAPAATQSFTSFLMESSKMVVGIALLLKTLAFLKSQAL
jgi:hypothetical protein